MRNFAIAATIVLTLATAAVWAQPTPGSSMAASGEIDIFALQVNARNLPVPVVQNLI